MKEEERRGRKKRGKGKLVRRDRDSLHARRRVSSLRLQIRWRRREGRGRGKGEAAHDLVRFVGGVPGEKRGKEGEKIRRLIFNPVVLNIPTMRGRRGKRRCR